MLAKEELEALGKALARLETEYAKAPGVADDGSESAVFDAPTGADGQRFEQVLLQTAARMGDNYPYFHPLYAGQMLKPPHPIARAAYALAMWINPNNHALDGGRASSEMEKEAVARLARMFGWDAFLGHLCGGGTMANMEALWIAGRLNPVGKIIASSLAHYTHERISQVLKLDFTAAPLDSKGRLDPAALEEMVKGGEIAAVVATAGTTGYGAVDPIDAIVELKQRYGFRLHVDAAYGGYYKLVDNLEMETSAAFKAISQADSIVIDPHKHGLQPYGCGCVLFRDPAVGRFYKHDSPYTYFSSGDLHLGEISLECSRAGAAATALWTTMNLLPLERDGDFAQGLARCRQAALELRRHLEDGSSYRTLFTPELDILVFAPQAASYSQTSELSRKRFDQAAAQGLHLALIDVPASIAEANWPNMKADRDSVICLRSCLMKPEHLDWVERIGAILDNLAISEKELQE